MKKLPNILITGTPGVGKSSICSKLSKYKNFEWLQVSEIVKANNFTTSYDDDMDCPILDEDELLDYLEPLMVSGGKIVEFYGCDFFPQRWFDAVFVTRCKDTKILYDRLAERNYSKRKIQSNVECEIFQTIFEEAMDSYHPDIIFQLQNSQDEDLESNVKLVKGWIDKYLKENE